MNPAIVIPTYWTAGSAGAGSPDAYDHSTPIAAETPELKTCLASLEQVRDLPHIIILVVCPVSATEEVVGRIQPILHDHPNMDITLVTHHESARIIERVNSVASDLEGEVVSLRGYGAIRNMGLAAAAIYGHDAVVFLDDDDVALAPDFMEKALYGLGRQTRQKLPILAKSGYFYDRAGSPLADAAGKSSPTRRWWSRSSAFNSWMGKALEGPRISRANHLYGGCFVLHAHAFRNVAFDPYITRGEDMDYLFNLRLYGLDVWFDNVWAVKNMAPREPERSARFLQDVYRWYYEREKLQFASGRQSLHPVTAGSLMPYPGPWVSDELDARAKKTAIARMLLTREHMNYRRIWRRGIDDARAYARQNAGRYLRLQNYWSVIMDALWEDASLVRVLERE